MNTQFEELIAKHLNGTLEVEEKRLLAILLRDPESQLYLAAKIDEQFLSGELLTESEDAEEGRKVLQRIRHQINSNTLLARSRSDEGGAKIIEPVWYKKRSIRWLGAAAASIILIFSIGILMNNTSSKGRELSGRASDKASEKGSAVWRLQQNTTGSEKTVILADGSTIAMAARTEIRYLDPFIGKREIHLSGKAYFKVAKDTSRPFNVVSGDIATTALGTEFSVTADKEAARITVRLYEGRVVIKPVNNGQSTLKGNTYLAPGQEFQYNRGEPPVVRRFQKSELSTPAKMLRNESSNETPFVPEDGGSWYMFNNQSLVQVFDQLAEMYEAEIIYNKADVQRLYFIGKFDRADSLENILKKIGLLNNLTVTKKGDKFIITK